MICTPQEHLAIDEPILVVGLFFSIEIKYLRTLWRLLTEIQSDHSDAHFRKQA